MGVAVGAASIVGVDVGNGEGLGVATSEGVGPVAVGEVSTVGVGVDPDVGLGVTTSAAVPPQAIATTRSTRQAKSCILWAVGILRYTNLLMNVLHPFPQGPEEHGGRRRGHVAVPYAQVYQLFGA
jgi:hypothetical protein